MVKKRGGAIFKAFIAALMAALLIGCAQTPETPPSSGSGENADAALPGAANPAAPESPDEPVPLIRPELPPIEVLKAEKLNLPYDEIGVSPKYLEIEIHYIDGDLLYASIIDMRANGDLLETKGIIAYDVSSEETAIHDYTGGDRIISFAIQGETIYYVVLGYGEENYTWSLMKSDLAFTDKTVLVSGDMLNPYLAPELTAEDGRTYLVLLDENAEGGTFAIAEITGDTLRRVISVDTEEEQWRNLTKVRIKDGHAGYMAFDETNQYVKETDLTTGETEILYTLPISGDPLFGFMRTEQMLFVSFLLENSAMNVTLQTVSGETRYAFDRVLAHEHAIQDGKVIVNNEDVLMVFGKTGEPERRFEIPELNIFPYFTVFDEDTLLVQDTRSGELYLCDIA